MLFRSNWLKAFIKLGTLIALLSLALICAVILYLTPALPRVDQLREVRLQTPLKVFSADGVLIGEFGEQKRTPVSFDQIPAPLIHAILSAEDDNFFNHHGVDLLGLLRAGSQILTSGQIQSGGSTITMQVARNFFLSRKQTFTRKFNEILLALQIENELSKEEILELYVNKIYLGKRAYGVEAAANIYYGTTIQDLELAQLAMIAGLPKAPTAYNPVNNPERALSRRNWILGRMLQLGYLSHSEFSSAVQEPVTARMHGSVVEDDAPYVAEMVRAQMVSEYGTAAYEDGFEVITTLDTRLQRAAEKAVQTGLLAYDERHGYRGSEQQLPDSTIADPELLSAVLRDTPAVSDLIPAVVTEVQSHSATLYIKDHGYHSLGWEDGLSSARPFRTSSWRGASPETASDVLMPGDLVRVRDQDSGWHLSQVPHVQGALVAIAPDTGAIKALQGGFDFYHSRFNRITSANRQPGSNLKPFLYAAALEKGFTPATTIIDAPIVFDDTTLEEMWRPENDSGKFYGPTRLREALYSSRNLVSIRVLREIGLFTARSYLKRFGFEDSDLATNLTLALGSQALPPIRVAAGYAVFANGGYRVEPHVIDRILDRSGATLFRAQHPRVCRDCSDQAGDQELYALEPESGIGHRDGANPSNPEIQPFSYPEAERVLDERVHFIIDSILRDVIDKGTGRRARQLGRTDIAGKTGTTNGPRDAWFSGYNPHMVATAWVGFDNNSLLGSGEFGGTAALPIWIDFMRSALDGTSEVRFEQPPGLVIAPIDPETGARAAPGDEDAILEFFLRENTPEERTSGSPQNPGSNELNLADDIF